MPYFITEDCLACGACLPECAFKAIQEGDVYAISDDECTECGACVDCCPVGAIIEK
ncbi:MAG: 4Fe-4S binding protein [Clostridiales bacterium]|nr:4Fe-4S binding protein [Clostridiales bacterium]